MTKKITSIMFFLIAPVAIAIVLFFILKFIDVFYPRYVNNFPLYLLLYPALGASTIYFSVVREKPVGASHIIVFFLLFWVSASGFYFALNRPFFALKLYFMSSKYEHCKLMASAEHSGIPLRICDFADRGPYFDGIAYDESDQITLAPEQRSISWWRTVKQNKENYSFSEAAFTARSLGNHFYYIVFDPYSPPFVGDKNVSVSRSNLACLPCFAMLLSLFQLG